MNRTSFTRKFSFNAGRKNSRENKQHPKDLPQGIHHHSSQHGSQHGSHHGSQHGSQHDSQHGSHHGSQHGPHPLHHHHSGSSQHHNGLQDKRQHSRRENPDVERVVRGIFGDVPLTDTERRFLSAAETGHQAALEQCAEENGNLNINCRDYLGRTALQLAVLGEHYDSIQYLLDKSSMDTIEEALLHAIKTENVKVCDMFLSHPMYSDKRARMQLEFQHGFYDQEESSSSFAPEITPVVLAAQCNNFDIVHMLIQKGFTIQRPHHYFCFCTECSNHKTFDRFVHSRSRLNAYRGLASPAYLSLSCDDPILTAFELSKSLQNLAETEKEYKNEYRTLSESCKSYAVDLLGLCRSNEEVMAALHGGSDTRDLSRIKMAIRYDQKKFIAHASCQEHLMSMWYSGVPWFQHQPFTMKLFLLPLGIMFIPVTAIVYVFLPYSRVGEVLRSPFMKFVNYICSYTAFLVLLFLATTLNAEVTVGLFTGTRGVVNSLIMFYVLGMFWAECKQLWEEGIRGYFSQMWNYMDITMLALYTAAYAIEGVIFTKVRFLSTEHKAYDGEDDGIPDPQILSRVLFSVANVMSFARIAYILPASETFGQLQISYGRMLQDVGKFIFIYFTVMIAFICGLTSLYSLSKNENFHSLLQTTGTLFWAAFGMGNSAAPQIEDGGPHNMVELVGYILYGVYILGAVVVLINMLIAMMSNTFEEIQECEDIEWKFARAKLWISFIEEGTTLPIPFNIVPTPKSILKVVYTIKNLFSGCSMERADTEDKDGGFEIDYKAIMHKVVLRYIHKMKFEKKGDSFKEDMLDAKEEILAQTYNLCTALHVRLDAMERQLHVLTSEVASKDGGHPSGFNPTYININTTATNSNTPAPPTATATVVTSMPASQFGRHTPLHMTRSVPGVTAEGVAGGGAGGDGGGLTASCYEPKREFVSRRWSYYQDRSRRHERHKAQQEQTAATAADQSSRRATSVRSDNHGRPPPQQQEQDHHPQLYRQMATTSEHSPPRQQFREDNSSRRQSDYSPVRYADRKDHSPVRLQDRINDLDDRLLEQTELREQPQREIIRDKRETQTTSLQQVESAPSPCLYAQYGTSRPARFSPLTGEDPAPAPTPRATSPSSAAAASAQTHASSHHHQQQPLAEELILRPDLTPTRAQRPALRREFSRTERHPSRGGNRSPNPGVGVSGLGGGGACLTPRASPSASPLQVSPIRSPHVHEGLVLVDDRHMRTQSLHRSQTRRSSRKPSVVKAQRSKEV